MRFLTVLTNGRAVLARHNGSELDALAGGLGLAELLAEGTDPALAPGSRIADCDPLGPPLRPPKIVAIGLNYLDHVRETGVDPPPEPLIFAKFASSVVGPHDQILVRTDVTERVDWEVELGVVVGRRMSNVAESRALDYVFGYTAANDVSARDVQFADGQWVRGKSFDSFCPIGPAVVTADEVPDPQALRLWTRVNGETVQDSSTGQMIFGVAELLSYCSRCFTLDPGDLVLTGTPWGCGEFMDPRRSLRAGDLVEAGVDGVGMLRNRVGVHPESAARWRREGRDGGSACESDGSGT